MQEKKESASHDETRQRAQRGTRQSLVARACIVAAGFVASAILTRKLGPAEYGIYGVIISQLLWLEILLNTGVSGATAKLMADGRDDQGEVERSARALLVGWAVLLLAISWVVAPRIASLMRIPHGELLLRIALLDLPFMAIFISYDAVLTGQRRFGILAAAYVAYGLAKLTGVLVLIAVGFSVQRALIVYVLSTCIVGVVLVVRFRPRGFKPRGAIIGEILAITAPIGLYLVAGQVLLNLDLWSLKSLWQGAGEVVGHYVASMNLSRMLLVISGAQASVVFASVAWAVAANDTARAQRHIQDATRFAVIIATAAWVILGLNASEVLSLLYSRPYAEGHRFLPLQLAALSLFVILDVLAQALMASGRQWFAASALTATIPLAWLSNFLLIPWLGPIGAATSLLLGLVFAVLTAGVMAYRRFGSLVRLSMLARVLIAAVVVGLMSVLFPLRGPLVLVKLALLGGLYLCVLYWLGEITRKDFELLKKSPVIDSP
jgi:O-antigen/teichoic acid export membrane protein